MPDYIFLRPEKILIEVVKMAAAVFSTEINSNQLLYDFATIRARYNKICEDLKQLRNENKLLRSEVEKQRKAYTLQTNVLDSHKKIITEQQSAISKLTNETKIYKSEAVFYENQITNFKKEETRKIEFLQQEIQNLKSENDNELNMIKSEYEFMKFEYDCTYKQLNEKIQNVQEECETKINSIKFDYEVKLQKAHAQASKVKDENRLLSIKYNKVIEIHKKKMEEFENKGQEPQFKLVQNSFEELNEAPVLNKKDNKSKIVQSGIRSSSGTSKNNCPSYNPLPIQISSNNETMSENLPKVAVKPIRRKLFNKHTEFID